jgi:hypothetical protein
VVDLISIEEIPRNGVLVITVFFTGYKDYFQNETRKKLRDDVAVISEQHGFSVTPILFSLVRTISGGVTHATGARWDFGYSRMSGEDVRTLYHEIKAKSKNRGFWASIQLLVADSVEGLE